MRALIQRVERARVTVEKETIGKIENGYVVLLGVGHDDTEAHAEKLWSKISRLRIFDDEEDGYQLVEYEDAKGICYRGWMEK